MENTSQPPISDSDEISLRELILPLWERRKFIGMFSVTFGIAGLLFSFLLPVEYTASITFIPQTTEKSGSLGNLGGLAAMAGINLQGMGGGSEIPPTLYPKLIASPKFKRNLLESKLSTSEGASDSYKDFYDKWGQEFSILSSIQKYTIGLPGTILKRVKSEKADQPVKTLNPAIIQVTEKENEHLERLEDQLKVNVDKKENSVQLTFTMPTAETAAQMAEYGYELLQKELIQYKINLAAEQLKFIEGQFEQKKIEFQMAQASLSNFRDQNQNLSSARATNREEALEAEYNLAFSVYSEMAKQLEQAKIQVSKDTPIFSVIQPVTVPLQKSSISKSIFTMGAAFFGLFFSVIFVFGKKMFGQLADSLKNPG